MPPALVAGTALAISTASYSTGNERLPEAFIMGDQQLELQATAQRSELWIDVYTCGVYAPEVPEADFTSHDQATAVTFLITTKLLPDAPPDVWQQHFGEVLDAEQSKHLASTFEQLGLYDRLSFHFKPGRGTTVLHDGEPVFRDDGRALMRALMNLLVGDDPASDEVKEQLLDSNTTG